MLRYLIALLFLATVLNDAAAAAGARGTARNAGPAIYETLRSGGFLEDYMVDEVGEIVGTVVEAAHRWPGYGINRPYVEGFVNIYLVDAQRLPEANVLERLGVELARYSLQGNALAHEKTGTLFVDTVLLKSLVTASQMFGNSGVDTASAVGAIRGRGIDAFRQFWDPARNPALQSAEYTDKWAMLASGALAFILAHEMGHIAVGARDISKRRSPMRFKDKEDKDKHWVCSDLVDEKYRHQQRIEKEADDFAVSLISEVLFPPGVLTKPLLRYELGARWYIVYSLSEQMVDSLYATESENIRAALRLQFGSEIYNELMAARTSSGKGSVHVFFPKSHPANIRRASVSLGNLAQSPYSLYYGDRPSTDTDIAMFEMMLDMECRNLRSRHGN